MNFHLIDALIVGVYLVATCALGIWARRFVEDLEGYVVAGRRVPVSLGIATLVATELGTVTFVYYGELGYVSGFAPFVIGLLAMTAYALVGKTGFMISALRRLRVMTIPEFYEMRYSRGVRLVGGIILFLGGVLNMGVFLKFDGLFLAEVTGLGSGALVWIMSLMLVMVIAYTVLGGMLAIVVTDFMQFVVLGLGMIIATVAVLAKVDLGAMADVVTKQFGRAGVDPFANPRFGWEFIVWIFVVSLASAALWQPGASKALASRSPAVARRVFFWTGLTFAGRAMVPMFWGVAALAYFGAGQPSAGAMPRLLGAVVPTGFLGLLVAGMLAASMSTYSAYLLAWSSVLARDVVACCRATDLSPSATIAVSRVGTVLVGLFLLVFGLWYKVPDTAFQYLYVSGTIYVAGAFGCVAAGIYWRKANTPGALASLVMGAAAPTAFLVLERYRSVLPGWLAWTTDVNLAGLLSFVLAALGMIAGSLLTQRSHPPRQLKMEDES